METPDSKDTADEHVAGASADSSAAANNSEAPASSGASETSNEITNTRPSAIERQIAAVSALGYGNQAHPETADRAIGRRETYFYADRRQSHRFALVGFFVLFLLVATGVALVFADLGRPVQKFISAVLQAAEQVEATHNSSPATNPSQAANPSQTPSPSPANIPQAAVPKIVPEVATPAAISVPIADVSVRSRPELLEQLVQVYRSQLADDPNDSVALAALNRLQQQSLSELETIVAAEDDSISVRSLEVVSRLFPELTDNPRYQYLIARMNPIHREAKTEPSVELGHSTALTTAASPPKTVAAPSAASAEVAKKHAENVSPLKPQIRVLSITPGAMVEQRFVPTGEGSVFMVEISYRNFKNTSDQSEVTLVARLGVPGDPIALAEVPVDIVGDRGTKSFFMETLMFGNAGEKYRLNFMLNGTLLASPTVRLSLPRQ